jgi:hypothetical protein
VSQEQLQGLCGGREDCDNKGSCLGAELPATPADKSSG